MSSFQVTSWSFSGNRINNLFGRGILLLVQFFIVWNIQICLSGPKGWSGKEYCGWRKEGYGLTKQAPNQLLKFSMENYLKIHSNRMCSAKTITVSNYTRQSCSIQIHEWVPNRNGMSKVTSYSKWSKLRKHNTVRCIFIYASISLSIQSPFNIQATDNYLINTVCQWLSNSSRKKSIWFGIRDDWWQNNFSRIMVESEWNWVQNGKWGHIFF